MHKECTNIINIKRALKSVGVTSKAIDHSIQNRLLYLLAQFQGWATTRTWAISNFQRLLKMGNHFCVHAVCGVDVPFAKGFCHACEADIQEYTSAQNIFTGIFLRTIYYYYSEGHLYRRALLSSLYLGIDSGLILSWIWLIWKMPMFCSAALLIIQAILYIWKKYSNVNLLACSNFCFNKTLCCF